MRSVSVRSTPRTPRTSCVRRSRPRCRSGAAPRESANGDHRRPTVCSRGSSPPPVPAMSTKTNTASTDLVHRASFGTGILLRPLECACTGSRRGTLREAAAARDRPSALTRAQRQRTVVMLHAERIELDGRSNRRPGMARRAARRCARGRSRRHDRQVFTVAVVATDRGQLRLVRVDGCLRRGSRQSSIPALERSRISAAAAERHDATLHDQAVSTATNGSTRANGQKRATAREEHISELIVREESRHTSEREHDQERRRHRDDPPASASTTGRSRVAGSVPARGSARSGAAVGGGRQRATERARRVVRPSAGRAQSLAPPRHAPVRLREPSACARNPNRERT